MGGNKKEAFYKKASDEKKGELQLDKSPEDASPRQESENRSWWDSERCQNKLGDILEQKGEKAGAGTCIDNKIEEIPQERVQTWGRSENINFSCYFLDILHWVTVPWRVYENSFIFHVTFLFQCTQQNFR